MREGVYLYRNQWGSVFCWLFLPSKRTRAPKTPFTDMPPRKTYPPAAKETKPVNKLMCHVCGEIVTDPNKREGDDCTREIRDPLQRWKVVDTCAGKLWTVRYRVIDQKSNRFWSRDDNHPLTASEDYAGVFDDDSLSLLLEAMYGTSDRKAVQTRCTIIVFPREGLPF